MRKLAVTVIDNPDLDYLLHLVEVFYSLDPQVANDKFAGYNKLLEVLDLKINQLVNNVEDAPYNKLISKVTNLFPELEVSPYIERQFPNYSLSIELSSNEYADITVINTLQLRVSLIAKYFTAFYDQQIVHKNIDNSSIQQSPVRSNVLTARLKDEKFKDKLATLKEAVIEVFPDSKFMSHQLLFRNKVRGGTPHGLLENPDLDFSLYNFLFDNDYVTFPFHVVE